MKPAEHENDTQRRIKEHSDEMSKKFLVYLILIKPVGFVVLWLCFYIHSLPFTWHKKEWTFFLVPTSGLLCDISDASGDIFLCTHLYGGPKCCIFFLRLSQNKYQHSSNKKSIPKPSRFEFMDENGISGCDVTVCSNWPTMLSTIVNIFILFFWFYHSYQTTPCQHS